MSLLIQNLSVSVAKKQILKDINLEIDSGQIHALMGPNGSGKTTLAQVVMGSPNYKIKDNRPKIKINNKDIAGLTADKRAREGLFLAFQNPIAIPGVSVANILRMAYQAVKKEKPQTSKHNPALSVWEFNKILLSKAQGLGIQKDLLSRSLNEDFSGGEKKKLEMLSALLLSPKYAIFDEIDTGLDVDALKTIADAILELKEQGTGILLITHYQRILKFARPDFVHIMIGGKIVESGGYGLAEEVEKEGYKKWIDFKLRVQKSKIKSKFKV